MTKYFHYLLIYFKYSFIRLLEYRFDFVTRFVTSILSAFLGFLSINFLYNNIPQIVGWNRAQLYLLTGTYNLVWGLFFGLFIHNLPQITKLVNRGELDLVLTKPINSQFLVSFRNRVEYSEISVFLSGLFIFTYGLNQLNLHLSLWQVLLYSLLILNSVVLCYSLWLINMTTAFWFGRLHELHEVFLSVFNINKYPTAIFSPVLRTIFTYFLPLAVLVFFPTQFLLNTLNPLFIGYSIFISLFFLFLSTRFWHFALRHYSSASS